MAIKIPEDVKKIFDLLLTIKPADEKWVLVLDGEWSNMLKMLTWSIRREKDLDGMLEHETIVIIPTNIPGGVHV